MDQSTLEAVSISALVIAVVVLMVLVIRWIVKKWFVGSWADKIIGGKRYWIDMKEEYITNFGDHCKELQDAIINSIPITYTMMEPIINTIYLAFCDNDVYTKITRESNIKSSRQKIAETVTNGLVSAPLAALILTACPYMFDLGVQGILDYKPMYRLLLEAAKDIDIIESLGIRNTSNAQEALMDMYFKPICQSIHDNLCKRIDYEYICNTWSKDSVTLLTIARVFTIFLADNTIGFTADKAAYALHRIVIPDVYELLKTGGSNIINNSNTVTLDDLPTDGEPRFKAEPK